MMAHRPPPSHLVLPQRAAWLAAPYRPPCLGPYRAQTMQCRSVSQCSAGVPLRATRCGYGGLMRCDDFNATMWRRGINYLLAEMRGDSLGPLRARMMPCPTPRSPEPSGEAETSLEGSGKARSAFIGSARPEPVPQPSGGA
jgi:hypothetical protein